MYINTDCANDGDGTAFSCAASGGAAGAYNTIMSVPYTYDLATDDEALFIWVAGSAEDTISGLGFTVSQANFNMDDANDNCVYIQCDSAQSNSCASATVDGIDTTAYRMSGRNPIDTSDGDCVHVGGFGKGIQIINDATFSAAGVSKAGSFSGKLYVVGNRIWCDGTVGSGEDGIDVDVSGGTAGEVYIASNQVWDCHDNIFCRTAAGTTCTVIGNTAVDAVDDNFYMRGANSTDTWNFYNNLAQGAGGSDLEKFSTAATVNEDFNICEDTTCNGTHSRDSTAVTFEDEANDNFRPSDTVADWEDFFVAYNPTCDTFAVTKDVGNRTIPTGGIVFAGAHHHPDHLEEYRWAFRFTLAYVADNPASRWPTLDSYGITPSPSSLCVDRGKAVAFDYRNRTTGNNNDLAGGWYVTGSNDKDWKQDVVSAGDWEIRVALGDPNFGRNNQKIEVLDDTTSKLTVTGTGLSANEFIDANGDTETAANWHTGNTKATITTSNTVMVFRVGDDANGDEGWISHLRLKRVPAAGGGSDASEYTTMKMMGH